ncbi:MAG: M50 family metallopeptidase [Myxococcaceae bacterium]|nr:M50 family metallopeptidase [Myxococcaceae bacterium]
MRYVLAIVALGLLVALHELGHLIAARILRVRVRRFSFGFGPPLLSIEKQGIRLVLGAIPLGGSVDIEGMNPHEETHERGAGLHSPLTPALSQRERRVGARRDSDSLASRPPWQRVVVHLAGPVINALFALLVLTALYVAGTHVPVPMTVGTVEPGSEGARAGLRPGDQVEAVNEAPVREWSTLVEHVAESADQPLRLTVLRSDEPVVVRLTPRADEDGAGRIGVSQQYVWRRHGFGEAMTLALGHSRTVVDEGLTLVWRLLRGSQDSVVSAPVAVFKQASDSAGSGLGAFVRVLASLSLALALVHLVPLPALDGGRIAFAAYSWATGRRVSVRVETLAHALGFVALVALMVALGVGELRRMMNHRPGPVRTVTLPVETPAVGDALPGVLPALPLENPPAPRLDAGVEAEREATGAPQVEDLPP